MQRAADGRAGVRTGFGIVLAAAVTVVFLTRFAPARFVLAESVRPIAAAGAIVFACIGFGAAAIAVARVVYQRVARERDDYESLSLVDATLTGFAFLGITVAVIAWIGVAMTVVITVVLAIAAAVGLIVVWRDDGIEWRLDALAVVLTAVPVIVAFVNALTPPNSPDELAYKLAVPHAYQLYGRLVEMPLSSHSYLVMGDHMVSLAALVLANGIAARLVHFAIFIATLCALHRLGSRFHPTAGAMLAGVVAWTPALMITAGWAWNDWSTLGLLVVAVDRFERWNDSTNPSDAAVAFAAAGCAASMKYTALPWIFALAVLLVVRRRSTPRVIGAAALIVAAFGSFFYLRNAIWTGSPIAPLLLPNAPAVSNYRSGAAFEGWTDLVRGYDILDPAIADESLGIVLPVAAIIGLAAFVSRERWLRDLALISAIQLPIVVTFAPGSRNTVNAFLPIAAAGVVLGIDAVIGSRLLWRVAAATMLTVALFCQGVLTVFALSSYEVIPYLAGQESAAGYLSRTRAFMRPYTWLARFTSPRARILLLGENRTLYLNRQFVAGGNLDSPRIAAWLSTLATPAAVRDDLRAKGITHVLLHTPWYRVGSDRPGMLEKEYVLQVSPATDAVLRTFLRENARIAYRDPEYLIFELR